MHLWLRYSPGGHRAHAAHTASTLKTHFRVVNSPSPHRVHRLQLGPLVALHPDEANSVAQSQIAGQIPHRVGVYSVQFW